jgi:azurin
MNRGISRRGFLRSLILVGSLSLSSLLIAACGGGAAGPTAVADTGKTVSFELSSDDTIEFNTTKLAADAGSKITVKLTNKSTDKLFNWVLAKQGMMLRVVTNGAVIGDAGGYLQPNDPNVLANTKLIKAGESDTVTFDAPSPGDYQYFCTFPGYYTRMNGILTVK